MKLSTRTEIDATPDKVFGLAADFDRLEAVARERGATVERLDDGRNGPAAARWRITAPIRGQVRSGEIGITAYVPGEQIAAQGALEGLSIFGNMELVEFAAGRTRMFSTLDMKPGSLKARMLVQSLKLARGTLERRLAKRMEKFARRAETA